MTTNCGLAIGIVGPGGDANHLDRTLIDVPSLGIQNVWARLVEAVRFAMVPGTPVVVGFIDGDLNQPIVLGVVSNNVA